MNKVSSMAYSSPSIVIDAGRMPDGRRVLYDDYREAYFWMRQNTDANAKIKLDEGIDRFKKKDFEVNADVLKQELAKYCDAFNQ